MTPEEALAMARECAAKALEGRDIALRVMAGERDDNHEVQSALLAIDRMEERVRVETERCARIAENLQFPEGYQWSDSNIQKFKFGAITAAAAIRETPHAEG